MKNIQKFQTDIGTNFQGHSIRHPTEALIRYNHIADKKTHRYQPDCHASKNR